MSSKKMEGCSVKLVKQLAVMFLVVALSAGAYAMIFVDGADVSAVQGGSQSLSLSGAALLFGSALLMLGNMGAGKKKS